MKRIMILVLAAVMGGQLCARTNYSWSDVNNAYEGNGSTNVTFNGTIFRFDPNGALYLSVHGSGRLTFKARGSYDGFSYVYNEGATSRYIRNSDEFATYTIDIANEGWHAVLWHTYPAGYIVASAWGEVKDICWNDEPIPYSDTAVKNGLVARYGLDGYLIDESGHGYTLHSNKAESYVDDRFGKADSAYWLDGSTTLFESETTESVRWEANFTYMYWFKVSEETALYDVKSSGIWGMSSSIKYIIGQTDIPLAIGTNGINVFEHGPSFLPAVFRYDADIGTAWHHIAVSLSNNQEVKVYLDGVMIGSFAKQRQSNVASLGLGQYDSGAAQRYTGIGTFGYGGRFRGGVDEARFYNRPLSAAEVKAVYDSERGATLYVNGTTGSDENPGTSPETAKKTIQSAIDVSVDGDTILVAPGTYDKFTSSNNCIRVESSDGPLSTIIDGHGVYTEANIMRLSGGIAGGTNTFVVGFTIQHLTRIDGGTIRRCIVRDNDTSTVGCGTFSGSVAENCLIINNRGMNGAVADASILRNCTMVGNSASAVYDGVCLNSVLENCIVYGNANNERQTWQYWFERSWLANWDHREIKVFDSDPKFVNAENGDYHLFEDSDCIDFGDNRYVFTDKDLDGNVRIGNGVVDIGCYESLIPPIWTVSFDACGGVASKDTMSVTNNTAIGELPTAELFGYDLLGWFTAAVGGTQVTPETIITNNVTFYAHWEKADLGVDYVLGGHWTSGTTASGEGLVFAGLDETAEGGLSVRLKSEDDCETWIETTVTGEMWVSFDWKTSCETFEYLELDRIEFSIDGHRQAWANGETDWTNRTFAVRGEGEHTIRFAYVKDESEFSGDDSVWVANVATTPKTAVATPVIDLPATYATESTTCAITTETEGATIRYKLDYYGDESEWFEYAGPFEITGSKTVVAYATKRNYYDSETVRASCERTMPWTLAECVNAPHLDFATGGDGEWKRTTAWRPSAAAR